MLDLTSKFMASSSSSKHALLILLLVCGLPCMHLRLRFQARAEKYGREYKNEVARLRRLAIFTDSLKYVAQFLRDTVNQSSELLAPRTGIKLPTEPAGLSRLAIFTDSSKYVAQFLRDTINLFYEFFAPHTGIKLPTEPAATDDRSVVPTSIDWRRSGVVTSVKNQGNCGSCWAFSAVAAIESAVLIKTGQQTILSEQELVDCGTASRNDGCTGGWMDAAFDYVARNGGIATEATYPYAGSRGVCRANVDARAAPITGYRKVPGNDERALMEAVAHQPVSVLIDASGRGFHMYKGGVYEGPCGTNLDHAVTVVGYGEDGSGKKFWIVKNSWGTGWGDEGYVLMKRDVPRKEGLCGIAMHPTYPTV